MWLIVHLAAPSLLAGTFSYALKEGTFPMRWKLIQKPGKPVGQLSSFRPLSLLDTIGKVFKLLASKPAGEALQKEENDIRQPVRIQSRSLGRRRCRKIEEESLRGVMEKKFCAAVSFDVQNALNTMPWPRIMKAMENARVPVTWSESYLD